MLWRDVDEVIQEIPQNVKIIIGDDFLSFSICSLHIEKERQGHERVNRG